MRRTRKGSIVPPRHRRRARAATGADVVVDTSRVVAMTDARTHRAHLVTDEAAAAGRADAGRRYVAVCGAVVLAASPATPETRYSACCPYWRRYGTQAALGTGSTLSRNRGAS